MYAPLPERMRPIKLEDFIGQEHLLGEVGPIKRMIESGLFASMIFWGPPGTGKTSLAELIAKISGRDFFQLSAVHSGVKEVREAIESAKNKNLFSGKTPILFIDEIHRFNKSQQDSLLAAVEKGWILLIGATTENPSFEVISALLSRCQMYTLKQLDKSNLEKIMQNAIEKDQWLSQREIKIQESEVLIKYSGGDARRLLNALELVVNAAYNNSIVVTNKLVSLHIQENNLLYDKEGEQHYDIVSAFIKSIRGSDPNATVYWLARMIEGGEDIKFIARRMLIAASEDIGNANPTALVIANNAFQAVNAIGYPEASIILSQCAIYLATSPKSNSTYKAIKTAQQLVKQTGNLPVPLHLRNAPTQLMKELNYGKAYAYSHNYEKHFIQQEYLPKEIENTILYSPAENTREKPIKEYLKSIWKGKYTY